MVFSVTYYLETCNAKKKKVMVNVSFPQIKILVFYDAQKSIWSFLVEKHIYSK